MFSEFGGGDGGGGGLGTAGSEGTTAPRSHIESKMVNLRSVDPPVRPRPRG